MVTALFVFTLLLVLNSLFNALIYAVRIRYFRITFIQVLPRKGISQADELQKKIFGPKQIGVNGNVDAGQGNRTSNKEYAATRQAGWYGE